VTDNKAQICQQFYDISSFWQQVTALDTFNYKVFMDSLKVLLFWQQFDPTHYPILLTICL